MGEAAERVAPVRVGNLRQMGKYSRSVRRAYGDAAPAPPEVPLPRLRGAESCLAVPAVALGELVGVLAVESRRPVAFSATDEAVLSVVASLLATAVEGQRSGDRAGGGARPGDGGGPPVGPGAEGPGATGRPRLAAPTLVRFFAADGSTFLDGEYLIKGVAGRILWSLLGHHEREGRVDFTNREVRLDPSLELPELRDNLESRLLLLKRRLEERDAPIRIEKTGRGRFRLAVDATLRLEQGDA